MLDIGAGIGRDSAYFAKLGDDIQVTAVEPAQLLADIGQITTQGLNVNWLEDSLPSLARVSRQEISFDLILLSAVWMHVPSGQRQRSLRKLANLLKPGGKLVITLRHGECQDERIMHEVCAGELAQLGQLVGLNTLFTSALEADQLGRAEVRWQTVVLQLPDDSTGAFAFIRHVALNDGKSGTHKLALMRVLMRIADSHPGAVLREQGDGIHGSRIVLPAGLVALYWCHQYKDLIDLHGLYQSPRASINMGFMSADGWHQLKHRGASDYRVGHFFSGADAIALHKTLSAALNNIKEMPCKKITLGNRQQAVFEVASKTVTAEDSLFLDMNTLGQWGEFSLPEHLWRAFSRYACWIEPVLISEWSKMMASFKGNAEYLSRHHPSDIQQALDWLEPTRTTTEVRKRFDALKQDRQLHCVWSDKKLKNKYAIDHCLPFARWPNNDLWNLLPCDDKTNGNKSDRLPSAIRMKDAEERMTQWWQQAWLKNADHKASHVSTERRFFAEANLALPGLTCDNRSHHDVFEALALQRSRLKEMQQLQEW